MLNRRAIIVPLGLLLEKVDSTHFIEYMVQTAKGDDSNFNFSPDLQKTALSITEKFNNGEIKAIEFEDNMRKAFGIKNMDGNSFWLQWSNILVIGNIKEKISLLQQLSHEYRVLFYLTSDTNAMHIESIAHACEINKISFEIEKKLMKIAQIPLYTSFQVGKNHSELIQQVVSEIRSKAINQQDQITIMLDDANKIKNGMQCADTKLEQKEIQNWCNKNNINVDVMTTEFAERLQNLIAPIDQYEHKLAVNR